MKFSVLCIFVLSITEGMNFSSGEGNSFCDEGSSPTRRGAILEMHAEPSHGDVCRLKTNSFFCPSGCKSLPVAPFCTSAEGGSPCRVSSPDRIDSSGPSNNQSATPRGDCRETESLERHVESNHGDICRIVSTKGFNCPRGCFSRRNAPFCSSLQESDIPCRVPGLDPLHPASSKSGLIANNIVDFSGLNKAPCSAREDEPISSFSDAQLERHAAGESDQGDVCRLTNGSNRFYCPVGCVRVKMKPFCIGKGNAGVCRVAEGSPSPTDTESSVCGTSSMLLESHAGNLQHGDICRLPTGKGYACPKGCFHLLSAPFCGTTEDSAAKPCRANGIPDPDPPAAVEAAPQAEQSKADESPAAARSGYCDTSKDPERKYGARLERHTLEDGHGDICRHPSHPADFFCPADCVHIRTAPYCANPDGQRNPCRMPILQLSKVERFTQRIQELERSRDRYVATKNMDAAAKAQDLIRVVKADRVRAKMEERG